MIRGEGIIQNMERETGLETRVTSLGGCQSNAVEMAAY